MNSRPTAFRRTTPLIAMSWLRSGMCPISRRHPPFRNYSMEHTDKVILVINGVIVPYSQRHPSILIYKHKASLRFANNDEPFQTFFKMECKKTHGSGRASNDSRPQKAACIHLQPSVIEGAKHSDGVRAGFNEAPSSRYIQPTRKLGLATKTLRKGHSSENILEPVPSSHSSLQHLL